MSSSATSAFAEVVAELDYPMVVVTVPTSGCLVGFWTQVSIDPPRVIVCISKANHTHAPAIAAPTLAVHVLARDDERLAEIFGELSGDDVDKLALVEWSAGPDGVPVLDDAAAWFAGRVLDRLDLGDHTGLVLEPVGGERRRPVRQLGYQQARGLHPGHPA